MYDASLVRQRLEDMLAALERVSRRFADVNSPQELVQSDEGLERLDSICMVLIATGDRAAS